MTRLRTTLNEWQVPVGHFRCDVCGEEFTLTPAPEGDDTCGAPECASYEESRDVSRWFEEGRVRPVKQPDGTVRLVPFKVIDGGDA